MTANTALPMRRIRATLPRNGALGGREFPQGHPPRPAPRAQSEDSRHGT
jgi:hypothetical protein